MKLVVSIALTILLFSGYLCCRPFLMELAGVHSLLARCFQYHDYEEIVAILIELNGTHPGIVDVFPIGESCQNQAIYCVRLTNESSQKSKGQALFVSCHHGNEQITAELALYFVSYVSLNYERDAIISDLLERSELYVVVALNVDRIAASQDEEQLNNYGRRFNSRGVDLNRNYDYAWSNGSGGPEPFSEPETQAIRDLVVQHDFKYALSFHSGTELILYPWGDSTDPAPDKATFIEIAEALSVATQGTPYMQSGYLYIASGEWGGWMYGVADVLALTCEIYGELYQPQPTFRFQSIRPPQIPPLPPGDERPSQEPFPPRTDQKIRFNPSPENIKSVLQRWLPAFLCVAEEAALGVLEASN